jgi:hypothetical protein
MHRHRTPHGHEAHEALDQVLLQQMLGPENQRPWAESELARTASLPGDVNDGLRRLRQSGLIHRWNDLATASRPAVRFHDITQGVHPDSPHERRDDRTALESLLAHYQQDGRALTDAEFYEQFSEDKRLDMLCAVARLDGDGLVERRGGHVKVSEAALRFDELMTL